MAYTEKVLLNGSALSLLLYECLNSSYSQEGFLVGDVTSEITNHISDSHNDTARLDTQIAITTVLPLPTVSLFYLPSGCIREDVMSDLLSSDASEIIGWYKYRKNSSIKPTLRDKLISKGLQKYFEKYHGKKTFVTCNLSIKTSAEGSTHNLIYKFGKINCFDMYEYIDDVSSNLGEKQTGYKKPYRLSPHCIFNKIVSESNVRKNNSDNAIMMIQEAVDVRLVKEAKIAAKNEALVRELEAEIKTMNGIFADKQAADLELAYKRVLDEKTVNREIEMVDACIDALKTPTAVDILSLPNIIVSNADVQMDDESSMQMNEVNVRVKSPGPGQSSNSTKPHTMNYASAVKKMSESVSIDTTSSLDEDLISFDVDETSNPKSIIINDNATSFHESSPEY
ncbi:BRISC complex subunit FAM175B-like isoform X1 [Leptidea sinapis]|uniref:BRISC complex subunit FAM175B-like isoform X1 n=2 Tax=Leptidea sinapis TaxID=189913 RepID=UPI002122CDD7|nr:BRISC complex subunit FAM175B-like isoform X1 [Leptidea sinapis]